MECAAFSPSCLPNVVYEQSQCMCSCCDASYLAFESNAVSEVFSVGQQVPLYLSEISPPRWRGTLNLLFQTYTIFGILVAACINYGTVRTYWGWRLSLGLAAVPAVILGTGALFLPDSPNSLVFGGKI